MTTESARPLATTVAAQHATIRALLAEVNDPAGERRAERFADLARYLAVHEAAEQVFLQRADTEHSMMVGRLEQLGPEDPYFLVQLGLLQESLDQHAEAVEKSELPALEASLGPQELRRAEDALGLVEVLVEDRGIGAAVPVDGGYRVQHDAARQVLQSRTASTRAARTNDS